MSSRLRFATCAHHATEVEHALRAEGQTDIEVISFPARCGRPPLSDAEVEVLLDGTDRDSVCVLGGPCMDGAARATGTPTAGALAHCLESFVDRGVLQSWTDAGAYAVSPGWAVAWRGHLKRWGFDQPTARRFFGETTSHILLVDTGVDPTAPARVQEFADFLGLPSKRVQVGLEHISRLVREQVLKWRLDQKTSTAAGGPGASGYALALSQIGRLAHMGTEAEVVGRIFDLFSMLCDAREMAWLPWDEQAGCPPITRPTLPEEALTELRTAAPRDVITPEGAVRLRIGPMAQPLAMLQLGAFGHPDRREEYMNLALSLKGPLELAVRTARSWQELEAARQQLASQADGYRILANSADGLVVYDSAGLVQFANPAAEQLLDLRAGDRLTHDLGAGNLEVVDADGAQRVVDARLVRIEWEGRPSRLASLRDVTEQRAAEEAVRKTQKMTLLGQLAGSVAHDFNNVLQAIGGSLEVARQVDGLQPDALLRLEEAAAAADRGAGIARRLLLFSRPTSRRERTIDAAAEITRMVPLLRQLGGDAVTLEVRCPEDGLHLVSGDGQLEAVLLNLLTNARDATAGHGHVLIDVREERGELLLVVEDDGHGIPEERMAQVFEPFFTTKGVERGTGLGLPTVRAAVDRMAGRLTLRSNVGVGTRFEIRLPLAPAPEDSLREAPAAPVENFVGSRSILLVDDESIIRETFAVALRGAGHEVVTAESGPAALDLLQRRDVDCDLLLTDVSMPEMDGFELAREAQTLRRGLLVLFMSGLADVSFPGLGIDPSRIRVLAKPFRLSEAVGRVEQILCELSG